LNNFSKVSEPAIEAWAAILKRVPNSRLILHSHAGSHREMVLRKFEGLGVDPGRIELVGYQPMGEYLQTFNRIDVALDPFPYPGGTTSCDGAWMGVPIVTLAGSTAVSRGGASVLSNLGLPELIAKGMLSRRSRGRLAASIAVGLPGRATTRCAGRAATVAMRVFKGDQGFKPAALRNILVFGVRRVGQRPPLVVGRNGAQQQRQPFRRSR